MPSATLTSKGQITLPKRVRDELGLKTGDTVEFVIESSGRIQVRAGEHDVADLRGLLKVPGRKPISVGDMDRAIGRAHRSRR